MSETEELHPIFTKDPEEWMQHVYKKVCHLLISKPFCKPNQGLLQVVEQYLYVQ